MSLVFTDETGLRHEVMPTGDVTKNIALRCRMPTAYAASVHVTDNMVTCLRCVTWVDHQYLTHCTWCGCWTGKTAYEWAIEDVCAACIMKGPGV